MNESSYDIYVALSEEKSLEDVTQKLLEMYDVERDILEPAIQGILNKFMAAGYFEYSCS